jgi:hypothetical protein
MASARGLRGIAHNLAHHTQSSVSWVHPHLAQVCHAAGVDEATVELLRPNAYPVGLSESEPLRFALDGLRSWFFDLLARHGYEEVALESVMLNVRFRGRDEYDSAVGVTIVTRERKVFAGSVDFI